MKHWCYYSRVVAYLEKVEALFPDETRKGAYLLWRDEDGSPLMIAGPGVDWFKGRGPMPDLNNLGHAVESPVRAQNASDGSPAANREHHHPKQQSRGRKPAVKPPTHRPSATSKATPTPPPATAQARNSTKQANKKRTHFVKAAQIRSNPLKSRQRKTHPCAAARQSQKHRAILQNDAAPCPTRPPRSHQVTSHDRRRPAVSSPRVGLDSRRRISHDHLGRLRERVVRENAIRSTARLLSEAVPPRRLSDHRKRWGPDRAALPGSQATRAAHH